MRYYLGENFADSFYHRALIKSGGTGNVLFSYASASGLDKAIEILKRYDDWNVMIDSGAYSIWNNGRVLNKEELLSFYSKLKAYRADLDFINLDVIPGTRGRKPTLAQAIEACEEGWNNYLWFKKKGFNTIPVFHEDDDWDYLERYKEQTDFIAISPANDSSFNKRVIWLNKVYANLKADYKTHGLAATSVRLLQKYPFYSVDSVNWKVPTMWGQSKMIKDRKVTSVLARSENTKSDLTLNEIEYYKGLQEQMTRLWQRRGVRWQN